MDSVPRDVTLPSLDISADSLEAASVFYSLLSIAAWYHTNAVVEFVLVARWKFWRPWGTESPVCIAATKRGRARRVDGLLLLQ